MSECGCSSYPTRTTLQGTIFWVVQPIISKLDLKNKEAPIMAKIALQMVEQAGIDVNELFLTS